MASVICQVSYCPCQKELPESDLLVKESAGGAGSIRTTGKDSADPCLTPWLPRLVVSQFWLELVPAFNRSRY